MLSRTYGRDVPSPENESEVCRARGLENWGDA